MSSAVVSTSAALGRSFVFDDNSEPDVYPLSENAPVGTAALGCPVEQSSIALLRQALQTTVNNQQSAIPLVLPASRLEIRPAPEMVTSGIPALDALTGGLPRGCLTEICGPASSGRTTVLLATLAAATRRGEFCAVIDATDALDPHSVAAAGVDLDRMLWVRCGENSTQKENSPRRHSGTEKKSFKKNNEPQNTYNAERRLEQVLRATDLLLESGGFGLIVLDLADLPPQSARRIPLTTWFRFRRAVEYKPTILLAIEEHPIAGSCSSLLLQLGAQSLSKEKKPEEKISEENFTGQAIPCRSQNPSREAAAFISPARKCRVDPERRTESRRDGTHYSESPITAHINHGTALSMHEAPQPDAPTHAHLLAGLHINAELIRSRLERKPTRSVAFETKAAWAG